MAIDEEAGLSCFLLTLGLLLLCTWRLYTSEMGAACPCGNEVSDFRRINMPQITMSAGYLWPDSGSVG